MYRDKDIIKEAVNSQGYYSEDYGEGEIKTEVISIGKWILMLILLHNKLLLVKFLSNIYFCVYYIIIDAVIIIYLLSTSRNINLKNLVVAIAIIDFAGFIFFVFLII
ncbi:hypothetical protein PV797_13725 [Clostridiaceae bacterium M8S5]|nr:hypothetical protein PV797_13725 [Clostridiaceae bacterium M8S5]